MRRWLRRFLFPRMTAKSLLRLCCTALGAYFFFGLLCRPCLIQGESMRPLYSGHGLTFCWTPAYWRSKPQRGEVVVVRFVGEKVFLLKRIVALEGDQVEFRNGVLLVNGEKADHWPVVGPCDWELSPRIVEKGHVYLVGDNRSMPINEHIFGQAPANRILGKPLW